MKRRKPYENATIRHTLEELGTTMGVSLDLVVEYDLTEGDRGDYYTPPSGPEFYVTGVTVTEYASDSHTIKRAERPDWFAMLDAIAARLVNEDTIFDLVAERSAEAYSDYPY